MNNLKVISEDVGYGDRYRMSKNYEAMRDVRYTTEILIEFKEAIDHIVYTLDNRIDDKDFANALSFILANQFDRSKNISTCKMLQCIHNLIIDRSKDLVE